MEYFGAKWAPQIEQTKKHAVTVPRGSATACLKNKSWTFLSARSHVGTAGRGTVDVRMAVVGNNAVNEGTTAAKFHIQSGTASDIGVAATAHVPAHCRSIKSGCSQFAAAAETNLHKGVTIAANVDGRSAGKVHIDILSFDIASTGRSARKVEINLIGHDIACKCRGTGKINIHVVTGKVACI